MRRIHKRLLTQGLTPEQLNRLVEWFAVSYDAGWRPANWAPDSDGALRATLTGLEDQQRIKDGDVPWV